jgi:hypothetical protein
MTMNKPPVVSPQEWESARQQLLVKEKELTRASDAVAALRRRMPRLDVAKDYGFIGPEGKASLLDLLEGRCIGDHVELPRHHRARTSRGLGGLARRLPAEPAV